MRMVLWAVMLSMLVGCGRTDGEGWDLGDQPIVIWTIPRPREEPPEDMEPVPAEQPDDPAVQLPPTPVGAAPTEPSVSPVACEADFPVLTAPGTYAGTLAAGRGELADTPCAMSPGKEQRLRLYVPRRMEVEISMKYRETEFSPALLLQTGCGANTADAHCSSPLYSHPEDMSAHIRAVLDAGTYTLLVDERSLFDRGEGGRFVVHVDEVDLDLNATCAAPDRLYPDNIGTIATPDRGTSGDLRTCFPSARSLNFWTIQVSPGQSWRVRAVYFDPEISQGPFLHVERSCSGTCGGPWGDGAVSIANETDQVLDYVVGVSDHRGEPYRVFAERITELAANSSCQMAERLQSGQTVVGDPLQGGAHAPLCGSDPKRQLYYRVDVPPQHRLVADVTNANVGVQSHCGADQCVQDPVNRTGRLQSYIITAADWSGREEEFQLTPHVVPLATNSTCFAPTALALGTAVRGSLLNGGDPAGSCDLVHSVGFTLWYEVTLPALSTIDVQARSDIEYPSIALEAMDGACGGSCLALHDPYFHGGANAYLQLRNDDATPRVVSLAVTSQGPSALPESFTIEATRVVASPSE